MASVSELVKLLEKAQYDYYESDTPSMSDEQYDKYVEVLRQKAPDHVFFKKPGPTPVSSRERLPIPMPSLKKIKPDTWSSWKYGASGQRCVISEKLDGISALWCTSGKGSLYLRGDGETGQTISGFVPHIQGLVSKIGHWVIRGELICPVGTMSGTLARNWVNGIVHKKNPSVDELSQIRFVAYQVLQPCGLTRSQQFAWLVNQGFYTAWSMNVESINLEILSSLFKTRRSESEYECDGIVIGVDKVPEKCSVQEPDDCVAYKEVSNDQCATTTVLEVVWSASKTGIWFPKIRVEPVLINTAKIQYCTAVNAKFVEESKLGPGTVVKIRRSGDVIPAIDSIVKPSVVAQMPPEGQWKMDGVHAVCLNKESNSDVIAKLLVASCVGFGVEGFKIASANALVEAGICSVSQCVASGVKKCQTILGNVIGERFHSTLVKNIQENENNPIMWILASPVWPRGFGESKLKAIYSEEPDVSKWSKIQGNVKGVGKESLVSVVKCVDDYIKWRNSILQVLPKGAEVKEIKEVKVMKDVKVMKGTVCFSGFRDAVAEKLFTDAGFIVKDSIIKDTKALFVKDTEKVTGKVTSAKKFGIPVIHCDQMRSFLATQSTS
jgi:DNA ligase (NAD+)